MELQVVLIGAVVFVISAVLIYLISAFTMKEKTFEEVIAEQRRQQEAEIMKAKSEKKADKDVRKRYKKKEKVKGDNSPKVSISESEKEPKMVNIELEPEIIEPMEDKPLKMSKKKDKPAKPILHNKDEKTPVMSEDFVEEIIHRGPTPMDDLELKLAHDKKSKKESKEKTRKQEPKAVVEEVMKVTVNKVHAAAPPPSTDARTSFKDKQDGAHAKLISSVKSASLNDGEVQSLIDILLNKQGGLASADWSKKSQKGDPVALLRRQLEEKERSLQEEQQMVMAANTKLKEIRQELNQEKMKFQAMEKSYKDKVDYQGREVQALHSRIQHTHDQHTVETTQMRTMIQKLEAQAGDQTKVQRLAEENKVLRETLSKTQSDSLSPTDANNLKQKVSIMEKELGNNALKLNASENTKKTLEQKLAKIEVEMKKYESQQSSTENVVSKRVDEISQELRKSEAKSAGLTKDLHKAEQAVDAAHKECVSLKTKLQELEKALTDSDQSTRDMEERLKEADRHKIDMEGNLKNLQKRIEDFDKDKSEIMTQIQTLKQENNSLSTELKTSRERQQGEGEEAPSKTPTGAQNGDVHTEVAKEATVTLVEHEKILSEKTSEIGRLSGEVDKRKSELSTLQQEFEGQKKKNNDLREKNWKAMDALEKSEQSVSVKVQSAIKENREELLACQTEVETFDKSCMQRLFPDISINKKGHKDWMTEFEKQVSSHLSTVKQQEASSDNSAKYESRIQELESHSSELEKQLRVATESRDNLQSSVQEAENNCTKLQSQVTQYRGVLGETENKLTQLENSVEAEERKWQERLQRKEDELQQVQQELASLRQEISKSTGSQEDISDIGFAYRCVEKSLTSIVDEMKEQVEDLQSQLKVSEDRCSQLQSQISEAEARVSEYKIKIVEVEKNSANTTELNNDLEELRRLLEAEKKKNKDLASSVVKLNGIIKTGHDALTQEQNLVEKLKQQLAGGDSKNSSALPNDTNSEVSKLRAKLEEREKQLEKELNSNKLLSQRLAASQGSLNEAGTSV